MPTLRKSYIVDFYSPAILGDNERNVSVSDLLVQSADTAAIREHNNGQYVFQIKNVVRNENVIHGVFVKFRENDLPHIGNRTSLEEKDIELLEGEGLIEKNYFLYDLQLDVITFQVNSAACNIYQVAQLFTALLGETVSFNPILTLDAAERLLSNDIRPTKLQLSVAAPRNPQLYNSNDFSSNVMQLMTSTEGASISLTISANAQGGGLRQVLSDTVKTGMLAFSHSDDVTVRVGKVWYEEGADPIDLVADRIRGKTSPIEMQGRYPLERDILTSLNNVRMEHRQQIRQVLTGG